MIDILIIHGAPGVGKTTVGRLLKKKLKSVYLDLDWIRSNHLDENWSNCSDEEERMSYEILILTLKKYLESGYKNIILNAAELEKLLSYEAFFTPLKFKIFTLIVDEEQLARRVLDPQRDSGWRNVVGSVEINRQNQIRPLLSNEIRINSTNMTADDTALEVFNALS